MPSLKSIRRRLNRHAPPPPLRTIAEAAGQYTRAEEFRRKNPPPPGRLKEGDICPCGCGGVMTMVDGVLTALTLDAVMPGGRVSRVL